MATVGVDSYHMYCYPVLRFFWFGWIQSKKVNESPLYFDNNPIVLMYPESWIDYVCFGFSKEAILKRLKKQYEKLKNIHSKH